jgi:thiamine biosynthesis lipoprotein
MEKMQRYIDKEFYALGTINYIRIYDCFDEAILTKAVDRVKEIEQHMSAFLPDSDISKINLSSGKGSVKVHKDTMSLLQRGTYFSKLSDGAFDMTVRPLIELWGIGKKKNYIPACQEIRDTLKLVNYKDLVVDEKQNLAAMKYAGQSVDLGGIAKGYAADEVKRILEENNITSAVINLGGNVVTMGNRPDKGLWQIGLQNPLAKTGQYLGKLSVSGKTIVTSGSNERFFIKDGIRYHHILDARTGYPAKSSLLSVTVVCDCSMDADALTTSLFVLGVKDGMHLLKQYHADALFVTENLGLYLTEGLINYFTINKSA